jgi:hypothetical protein
MEIMHSETLRPRLRPVVYFALQICAIVAVAPGAWFAIESNRTRWQCSESRPSSNEDPVSQLPVSNTSITGTSTGTVKLPVKWAGVTVFGDSQPPTGFQVDLQISEGHNAIAQSVSPEGVTTFVGGLVLPISDGKPTQDGQDGSIAADRHGLLWLYADKRWRSLSAR